MARRSHRLQRIRIPRSKKPVEPVGYRVIVAEPKPAQPAKVKRWLVNGNVVYTSETGRDER